MNRKEKSYLLLQQGFSSGTFTWCRTKFFAKRKCWISVRKQFCVSPQRPGRTQRVHVVREHLHTKLGQQNASKKHTIYPKQLFDTVL